MFSERLKQLLIEQSKKQGELASFVGVKPNTVSDWINKGNSPKIEHLCRISEFLNVSLEFLLTGNRNSTYNIPDDQKELLQKYFMLDPIKKGKVLGYIDSIMGSNSSFCRNDFETAQELKIDLHTVDKTYRVNK